MNQHRMLLTVDDIGDLAHAAPGLRIAYGNDPLQFGELSLPDRVGTHPLIINVHGGAWLDQFNLEHSRALASALAAAGFAVWNIEYRRVGNTGGGWPGTFLDVARAADHARRLAQEYPLDLAQVVAIGHSSGGHLALWLGARPHLPVKSPLFIKDPLPLLGVVALAPATDLETLHRARIRDHVVDRLVGGAPTDFPERYDWVMPSRMLPLGLRQLLIVGEYDDEWRHNCESYAEAARQAHDTGVEVTVVPDAGHFELITPGSLAWSMVLQRVRDLLSNRI